MSSIRSSHPDRELGTVGGLSGCGIEAAEAREEPAWYWGGPEPRPAACLSAS